MKLKHPEHFPVFNRDLFLQDAEYFGDPDFDLVQHPQAEVFLVAHVLEHLSPAAPMPGFTTRFLDKFTRQQRWQRFTRWVGWAAVFGFIVWFTWAFWGFMLTTQVRFLLNSMDFSGLPFNIEPVFNAIWTGLSVGLEAITSVLYYLPLWLLGWSVIWSLSVASFAITRRRTTRIILPS